jgi:hypothetical protein
MPHYASVFVAVILQLAFAIDSPKQELAVANTRTAESTSTPTIVAPTSIEKALDELRARFPNSIVIGFEELFDPRPDKEPQINLGSEGLSLEQVLKRIRRLNPLYRIQLLHGSLIHVYPARKRADPVGLLDIRLRQFSMPQDSCLGQAIENIDESYLGYAPELTDFLRKRKREWYRKRGQEVPGRLGDIPGNCYSSAAPAPAHRNITVRDALNLMAKRSLQVSRGEVTPNDRIYPPYKPLSWKFRFRRDSNATTGLGGIPLFQVF